MASVLRRASPRLALALALIATGVGIRWNTFAAGGSDSHCYLQQARIFTEGAVALREPLARQAGWAAADVTFAPAGFVPSRRERGASVPICPPGLSLVMAPLIPLGAAFLVVPMLGGVAVWCTFALARQIAGAGVGLAAAFLFMCSPIFLFQIVQPMSDIPATAWWLATLVAVGRATPLGHLLGGGLAGLAALTRPNLSPLAAVVGLWILIRAGGSTNPSGEGKPFARWREIMKPLALFAGGLLPGVVVLLALQQAAHGSPFRTGYGDPAALFAWTHVAPNLRRYLGWLIETHGPLLALAAVGPFTAPVGGASETHEGVGPPLVAWVYLAMAVTTVAVYLPYLEFSDWSYLRFLLPALPLLIALALTGLLHVSRMLPRALAAAFFVGAVAVSGGWWIHVAVDRLAFRLQTLERHFIDAGHVAARLPANAVVVTVLASGSVRFHGRRPTLLWESLAPDQLESALAELRERGKHPYLLIEEGEADGFRQRFRGHSVLAELDWPPAIQVERSIRLFDPEERTRFHADGRVRTAHLRSPVSAPAGSPTWADPP